MLWIKKNSFNLLWFKYESILQYLISNPNVLSLDLSSFMVCCWYDVFLIPSFYDNAVANLLYYYISFLIFIFGGNLIKEKKSLKCIKMKILYMKLKKDK